MLKDLILKSRSYRRFYQDHKIEKEILEELVELARLSPSAANKQPLKYILSNDPEKNNKIFPYLGWAAYLTDWSGPVAGERPSAYIIIVSDNSISDSIKWGDHSIAAQSILLGAAEKGLGGCMIGAVRKEGLSSALLIPDRYSVQLVVALGKPRETVVIDSLNESGNIKYWRDSEETHHVPKRSLEDIILDI